MNKNIIKSKYSEFIEIIKSIGMAEIEKGNIADDPIVHVQRVLDFIKDSVDDFPNPKKNTLN